MHHPKLLVPRSGRKAGSSRRSCRDVWNCIFYQSRNAPQTFVVSAHLLEKFTVAPIKLQPLMLRLQARANAAKWLFVGALLTAQRPPHPPVCDPTHAPTRSHTRKASHPISQAASHSLTHPYTHNRQPYHPLTLQSFYDITHQHTYLRTHTNGRADNQPHSPDTAHRCVPKR